MPCKHMLIYQLITVKRINQITSGILTFLSYCFLSGNICPVFAATELIDKPSPEAAVSSDAAAGDGNGSASFFTAPSDIVLNAAGDLALINNTEADKDIVTRCTVDRNEGLSDCHSDVGSLPSSLSNSAFLGLAFDPESEFVFATSDYRRTNNQTVWQCRLGTTNVLKNCRSAFDDYLPDFIEHFNGSDGIVIHPSGNFAYVVNRNFYIEAGSESREYRISRCSVNAVTDQPHAGRFSDCIDMTVPGPNPAGITLNSSGTLAFITNACIDRAACTSDEATRANTVTRCQVNTRTGALTDCEDAGGTEFNSPLRITLNKSGTCAFIASTGNNNIVRCVVDVAGNFTNCQATGSGFQQPSAVVLNHNDTAAFITNFRNSTVSRCLVDSDGNFSACRNALHHVSVVDTENKPLTFLNLPDLEHVPAITINNTGVNLSNFHLDTESLQHATLGESCSSGAFNSEEQCQLLLKQGASSANTGFTIKLFNGDDLLYTLPVGVSTTLSAKANDWPITSFHASQGEVGTLTFTTSSAIDEMSIHFDNPQLEKFFQGEEYLNRSKTFSLQAGGSFTLTYFDAETGEDISGLITVNQGSTGIYHLPVSFSDAAILEVTNTVLPRYNTTEIMLRNLSDRPLTDLQFLAFNSDIKLVKDNCHGRIDAGASCSLSYFAGVDQSVALDFFRVTATGILPVSVPLFIGKVPEARVIVHNRGGYVMRVYYPELKTDGSIGVGKTGSFTNPMDKTIKVAVFNDPDNLPDSVVSVKNIKLDIVASVINRYLPACDGGEIRCTRATVNANCYYVNSTIKADGYGCLKTK